MYLPKVAIVICWLWRNFSYGFNTLLCHERFYFQVWENGKRLRGIFVTVHKISLSSTQFFKKNLNLISSQHKHLFTQIYLMKSGQTYNHD